MADIRFADISEWQSNFDADAYLKAGHTVIIVRAHNGNRPDKLWPARRDYVRGKRFAAVGYYHYLVADRDAAAQARDFTRAVGSLKPNEFPILDLEEGSGAQSARARAWFALVDPWAGFKAGLYSSAGFFRDQLGGTASWDRPTWIASVGQSGATLPVSSEPATPHTFWQNSWTARFPGLAGGVDGNIYHGTAQQFLTKMRGGTATAPAPPKPEREETIAVASMHDGRLEVFEELPSGEIVHRWNAQGGGWSGKWESLGTPGR